MADIHTIIKLRRTFKSATHGDVKTEKLEVGEPASIKPSGGDEYLVIGEGNGKEIQNLKRFKAFDKSIVDNQVFVKSDDANQLVKDDNITVINPKTTAALVSVTYKEANTDTQSVITDLDSRDNSLEKRATNLETKATELETRTHATASVNTKLYLMGLMATPDPEDPEEEIIDYKVYKYNENVYVTDKSVLKGAAWNDFAEYRDVYNEYLEPGTVVCECGNGVMERSVKRLQPGAAVISDTYGMIIGQDNEHSQPVAVAGRVLVNAPLDEDFKAGDPVCAGEFGMISKMNRLEVILFPDRILGYVSEIPDYDEWNGVKVGYRIWIKVK